MSAACYVFTVKCQTSGETWTSFRRGLPQHSEEWLGAEQTLKASIARYGRADHVKSIVCLCNTTDEAHFQIEMHLRRLKRIAEGKVKKPRVKAYRPQKTNYSPEFLAALSKRSKNNRYRLYGPCTAFILTDPKGKEHFVSNINEWCKNKGLTAYALRWVAKGIRKHHKHWTARYVDPNETWVPTKMVKPQVETEIAFAPSRSRSVALPKDDFDNMKW